MKKLYCLLIAIAASVSALGQGMHFSQYYNAPLLLNPANTALMPDADYRAGVNYRNQWASVPVPYRTTAAYVDMQALRNQNLTNWAGVGLGIWNDKAGNGELSLTRVEGFLAYHIMLGEYNMLSLGASAAFAQRSVDFNKLTFDRQWDGFIFNPTLSNGESGYTMKTTFFDLSTGVNYAFFPNEDIYLKIGVGLAHILQPKETFYGQENKLGLRPTANVDLLLKTGPSIIINPSLYYTTQKNASEFILGSLIKIHVGSNDYQAIQLIGGGFYRVKEAFIGAFGLEYGRLRIMSSYDFTTSSLTSVNKGRGAFELGIRYEGVYGEFSKGRRTYNCPRF